MLLGSSLFGGGGLCSWKTRELITGPDPLFPSVPLPLALHLQSLQCPTAEPGDRKRVPELCSCPIVFLVCFLCRFQCPQLPEYLKLVFRVPTLFVWGHLGFSVPPLFYSLTSPHFLLLFSLPPLPAIPLLCPLLGSLASSSVCSPTLSISLSLPPLVSVQPLCVPPSCSLACLCPFLPISSSLSLPPSMPLCHCLCTP